MTLKNYKGQCKSISRQIEVYSMMRAGQHAIINWIIKQYKRPVYFRNNILAYKKLSINQRGRWHNLAGHRSPVNFPLYIFNIEDSPVKSIESFREKRRSILEIVRPKSTRKIMIIRDPFNMFASRYKFFHKKNRIREESGRSKIKINRDTNENSGVSFFDNRAVKRWKEYAREYIGITNNIKGKRTLVNYNLWVSSKKYRKEISKEIGLKFSDSGINSVPKNGYGSSFDGVAFNGAANKMDVLARWKMAKENEILRSIFSDKELLELSGQIYPRLTAEVISALDL